MFLKNLCCGHEPVPEKFRILKEKPGTLLICQKCKTYWRMFISEGIIEFEKIHIYETEELNEISKKFKLLRDYLIQNGWRPKTTETGTIWAHPEVIGCLHKHYDFDTALLFQSWLDQTLKILKIK